MPGSHYSICSAYVVRIFSALMLTDSVHTAHGCGPAVRSRSGASAAATIVSAARAELK